MKILIIHGPNLNMLGIREPEIYGRETLADINAYIEAETEGFGVELSFFQSNHEGAIIDKIHEAHTAFDGIVINPGAYTHYSYAIADALASVNPPAVEVHISDIHKRESFRRISVTKDSCIDQIYGLGKAGYVKAVERVLEALR